MKTQIKKLLLMLAMIGLVQSTEAQFTYITNNGAIAITGYTGSGGNITIPSTINGLPVTTIGDYAFEDTALYGVTIPDSVISIGTAAFYYCYTLANVTIPANVTNIGVEAFSACPVLGNIAVNATNPAYAGVGGVLFNKTLTALIQFPEGLGSLAGSYTISNTVTSIGPYAFWSCYGLTNVTIGNSVTNIGNDAFDDCSGLKNVTIGNSVTIIGDEAFSGCSGLTSVAIPDSVTSVGASAFEDCGLTNMMIGNSVTGIGTNAFDSCTKLTSVTIPNNVTNIGDNAFQFCTRLTNITMGISVANIGAGAFSYCYDLHQAYFQGNAPGVNGGAGSTDNTVFKGESGTAYFLSGTTGWGATFGGFLAVLWDPRATTFNVADGHFGFNITGPTNAIIVVEACANLVNPIWLPVSTNTLTGGASSFSDSQSPNNPSRFYRFRSP